MKIYRAGSVALSEIQACRYREQRAHLRRRAVFFSVLVLALVHGQTARAEQAALFGPETFVRQRGSPTIATRTFSAENARSPFTIVIENGVDGQFVSSAVVRLNGITVVGPNAFNQQVRTISLPVELQSLNTLTVELRSAPGSSLTITVFGQKIQTVVDALAHLEATHQIPTLDRSTSLGGPDLDVNGVRDDLDAYIQSLSDTTPQKGALRQTSKAIAKALLAGAGNASPAELRDVSTAIARAVHCVWDRYEASTAGAKVTTIQKLMVNTPERFNAYELYNAKRTGTASRLPRGETCDTP